MTTTMSSWLIDTYRQPVNMTLVRAEGYAVLRRATHALNDVREMSMSLCNQRFQYSPATIASRLAQLEENLSPACRELLASINEATFDAACLKMSSAPALVSTRRIDAADIERELEVLRAFDWVAAMTVSDRRLDVTTRDVIIEFDGATYNFGAFTITLKRQELQAYLTDDQRYVGSAIDITGSHRVGSHYHPHVSAERGHDGGACFGDAEEALDRNLSAGLISDVFLVLWTFLNTYNGSSPLHGIENFDNLITSGSPRGEDEDAQVDDLSPAITGFMHSVSGDVHTNEQRYDCPACGRMVLVSEARHEGARACCAVCHSSVVEELREDERSGGWQCFNCHGGNPNTAVPALTRRGVRVCDKCISQSNGQVSVRYTAHWNSQHLLAPSMPAATLFARLRPASYGVDRFTTPAVQVQLQTQMVTLPGRISLTVTPCACGRMVAGNQPNLRPCAFAAGAAVCDGCDPDGLSISVTATEGNHLYNNVQSLVQGLIPATVRLQIRACQRREATALTDRIDQLSRYDAVRLFRSLRRVQLERIAKPANDAPVQNWIAWLNHLLPAETGCTPVFLVTT